MNLPIEASSSALLVVDMQNAFCHPEGGFAQAGRDVSAQGAIVPTVISLVRAAHRAHLPVIWTIQEGLGEDDLAMTGKRVPIALGSPGAGIAEAWCIRNTWDAELVDELRDELEERDHVVRKHRMSSFYATTLDAILRMRRIQLLVVTGVNTEKCVESTVRDASFRDYDVLVVEDAVATTDQAFHTDSLRKIDAYFGGVVDSASVVRRLQQLAAGPLPTAR
jgi:ureidoacrylate peracid hydrolase